MSLIEAAALFVVAFVAGAINAVAGGGSLISFPALLAAGYPAKAANVTNTVALWPGLIGGSYGYRRELGSQRRRIAILAIPSILGAIVGSAVLLSTPQNAFNRIVPGLLLFAIALMAFQDQFGRLAAHHKLTSRHERHIPLSLLLAIFVVAIYGAYFGAGVGIIILAVFGILMPDELHHSNALKGMLSLLINGTGVVYFALFGPVRWAPAAIMAVGALLGGYLGVGLARRLGRRWLRRAIIAYGLFVVAVLVLR